MNSLNKLPIFDHKIIQKKRSVRLYDHEFDVLADGVGAHPCLTIGIGSLFQRSLSKRFRELFTLYSADLYWVINQSAVNINEITIEKICKDIIEVASQLNLKNYFLLGHSVFGGLAVEAAKYQDQELAGIIGSGATPGWDKKIIEFKNQYFLKHASPHRQARFKAMQKEYEMIKSDNESLGSLNAYYAESAKYFAEDISKREMECLWSGIKTDDKMVNHLFNKLLLNYQFDRDIDKIDVPVIVAGGRKDFDSVPLEIWQYYPRPELFELLDCGETGHWPHLEDQKVFDSGIEKWLEGF